MDQLNLSPLPPGRYFAQLYSSANEISDWAIAQFFHDAGRHFAGDMFTVRVDPIMREGQQHGWQLIAFPTAKQEIIMADTATDPQAAIGPDEWIGKYVVVRTRDAGVHAGILKSRSGRECELTEARRLWFWQVAGKGAFLSGVATLGLDHKASKIGAPIDVLLTENCEIIACTAEAAQSIAQAPTYERR